MKTSVLILLMAGSILLSCNKEKDDVISARMIRNERDKLFLDSIKMRDRDIIDIDSFNIRYSVDFIRYNLDNKPIIFNRVKIIDISKNDSTSYIIIANTKTYYGSIFYLNLIADSTIGNKILNAKRPSTCIFKVILGTLRKIDISLRGKINNEDKEDPYIKYNIDLSDSFIAKGILKEVWITK